MGINQSPTRTKEEKAQLDLELNAEATELLKISCDWERAMVAIPWAIKGVGSAARFSQSPSQILLLSFTSFMKMTGFGAVNYDEQYARIFAEPADCFLCGERHHAKKSSSGS